MNNQTSLKADEPENWIFRYVDPVMMVTSMANDSAAQNGEWTKFNTPNQTAARMVNWRSITIAYRGNRAVRIQSEPSCRFSNGREHIIWHFDTAYLATTIQMINVLIIGYMIWYLAETVSWRAAEPEYRISLIKAWFSLLKPLYPFLWCPELDNNNAKIWTNKTKINWSFQSR